jgi:Holliday junction resolvase-like predicted endonuclease
LLEIKKESPESFLEAVAASNLLSEKDLLKHGELQNKAMKWLYNKGFIAAGEVTLPTGRRADVIGHDEEGKIVIVEVKAAVNDFKNDEKWRTLEVIEKDRLEHEPNNREKIMHLVRRTLSRKYVFGY